MKWIYALYMLVLLTGCRSTTPVTQAQIDAIEKAVKTQEFTFKAQWAEPLDQTALQVFNALRPAGGIVNGNRVHIENGGYYIRLKEDQIFIDLPYFGKRQISGGLPGDTGIEVEAGDYTWEQRTTDKDEQRSIDIQTASNGESYDISIRLFAQGKASVVVNSTQRQSIRYVGTWL